MRGLKRAALTGVLAVAVIAVVLSLPLVTEALVVPLQNYSVLTDRALAAEVKGSAAIVILSAGRRSYAPEFGGETVDALSLERVRYGAMLARRTGFPVLVSGGAVGGRTSLALLLGNVLERDYGVRAHWLEGASLNTAENAVDSATILKGAGIHDVILVTHAWHMRRAEAAFTANGLHVIPAPTAFYRPNFQSVWEEITPAMSAFRMSGYAVHELVGLAWYRLRYGY